MKFNNRNVQIGSNVELGINVKIGDNTIIYDNVVIGDNSIIANNCVIGEPLHNYYFNESYRNPETIIGINALIRSHTIIYAGSKFGKNLTTGHNVTIREESIIGDYCQFGSYNDIQGFCELGNYTRCQSFVNIGQRSKIGNYNFFYPNVVLTNDPTPPSNDLLGLTIGDFNVISTGSVLLPNCIITENCLVAANSSVGGYFEEDSFISGAPAKRIGKLSKMPFFNSSNKRHYPWRDNFKRGMPWTNSSYDEWILENEQKK